jgi:hypothetical protein
MTFDEQRLILDRSFDASLDAVLAALVREGFAVNPLDAGDLHRPRCPGRERRYASLDAVLPEFAFHTGRAGEATGGFGCRVSVFELTMSCTLVTVETPMARYPVLSALLPRVADRIERFVKALVHVGVVTAA